MTDPTAQSLLPRQTSPTIGELLKGKNWATLAATVILTAGIAYLIAMGINSLEGEGSASMVGIATGTTGGAVALLGTSLILYRACALKGKIQKIEHLLEESNNRDDLSEEAILQFYEANKILLSLPEDTYSDRLYALRDQTRTALRNKVSPTFARLATNRENAQLALSTLNKIVNALFREQALNQRIVVTKPEIGTEYQQAHHQIQRNIHHIVRPFTTAAAARPTNQGATK